MAVNNEVLKKILSVLAKGPASSAQLRSRHFRTLDTIELEMTELLKTGRVRKADGVYHLPAAPPVFGSLPYTHAAAVGRKTDA